MWSFAHVVHEALKGIFHTNNALANLLIAMLYFIILWQINKLIIGNEFVAFGMTILVVDLTYAYIGIPYPDPSFYVVLTLLLVFNFLYIVMFVYKTLPQKLSE
jgi:hypothetical protein